MPPFEISAMHWNIDIIAVALMIHGVVFSPVRVLIDHHQVLTVNKGGGGGKRGER